MTGHRAFWHRFHRMRILICCGLVLLACSNEPKAPGTSEPCVVSCDDGDPCTVDTCGEDNACHHHEWSTYKIGGYVPGRFHSPDETEVALVLDHESNKTSFLICSQILDVPAQSRCPLQFP